MKKIKHKSKMPRGHRPAWVIGYVGSVLPAGYLSAWYDEKFGGPLQIRFPNCQSNSILEVAHVDWKAEVRLESSPNEVSQWQTQVQWEHTGLAQVVLISRIGVSRLDAVLFVARLGQGLTLLTGGTAFDLGSQVYWNPSDWSDHSLANFRIEDHVRIHQEESLTDGRQWFVTRGLAKFGFEELEVFRPRGLSDRPTKERLLDLAEICLHQGKSPKTGAQIHLPGCEKPIRVVNHRTVSLSSGQLNVREVNWD